METVREQPKDSNFLERVARGLHQLRTGGIGIEMDFGGDADTSSEDNTDLVLTQPGEVQPERPPKRPDNGWSAKWD